MQITRKIWIIVSERLQGYYLYGDNKQEVKNTMKNLPKSFFDLIETSDKPVLVDFYADWCGPCKMVSPAIKKVAGDFKGRIITIKINVDHKQQIAARYQIQSIPTIMMFYKGKDIMRLTGAYPYEAIRSEVENSLRAAGV